MAPQEHPLDDEAFRDSTSAAHTGDGAFFDANERIGERLQEQAEQRGIGHNGHQHVSGPLAPLWSGGKSHQSVPGQHMKHPKWLPLALGLVGLIVILTCLGLGAFITFNLLSLQSSLNSPETTIDDFYSALRTGHYQSAYNQLSSSYQQKMGGETAFQNRWEFLQCGSIQSYQIGDLQTQGESASASVEVVRGMQGEAPVNLTQKVRLIVEAGGWKIDNIDPLICTTPPGS